MSESRPTNQAPQQNRDVASLTLLQLFSSLKLAQAWAVITVLFAILGGSFGLGYKLRDLSAQSELVRLETERLQDTIKQFRGIQTKERFLALYLRYMIGKDAYSSDASEENREAREDAGDNLSSYIRELLERGEEASEEIDLRGLYLGKSGGSEATVKFGYDGSVWPVPPEFGFAATR